MLRYLSIRHLAVIERVELELDAGLTVLTGETGAGKSILVEAVGLLLGARASSDLVRTGEELAVIEAQFDVDGTEVIVRREISSSGRSRAFVNGALATAGALRELSARLIEVHGQHEHHGLLDPESHLDLLDAWAGLEAQRDAVGAVHARLTALRAELDTLRLDEREKAARVDLLTFQRDEIARAALQPGEDEALGRERARLAHAERLQRLSAEAYAALYEHDAAVIAQLAGVWKRVAELASIDADVAPYLESREAVQASLQDLAYFLRDYAEGIDASPERLQAVEDRLAVIERLKRKYGPSLDEAIAHGERCRQELETLRGSGERAAAVQGELEQAEREYRAVAGALSAARREAAGRFAGALVGELEGLALGRTRFELRFQPEGAPALGPKGLDRAEFFVSTNPGEDLRPLSRIVSGGELSRLMLAIKTLSARRGRGATLIFDEVDAGIGGATAEVVGRRLRALANDYQVLCITHLPQIAACGHHHIHVAKSVRHGRTVTTAERLDPERRAAEIARMMAGEIVTGELIESARQMIAGGATPRRPKAKGESERRKAKERA